MKRAMRYIHPGEILRDEIITANKLTVTETARLLGISRVALSNIINGNADITPEMCYRIATVFGGTAEIWANLQTKYNLRQAEQKVKTLKLTPYQPRKAV